MPTSSNKPISLKLHKRIILTFILTTVVAILLVGSTLRYVLEKTTIENWKKRQEFVTLEFAPQCDFEIEEALRNLEFLSRLPAFSDLPYVDQIDRSINGIPENVDLEKRDILQGLIQPSGKFSSIFILRPNGDFYLVQPFRRQLKSKKYNFSDRSYYKEASRTKSPVISDSFFGASGIPIVVLVVPVVDKGGVIKSYICGAFYLKDISRLVNKKRIGDFDMGFIVDRKGHLVAHTDTELVKEKLRQSYIEHSLVSRFLHKGQKDTSKVMIEDCVDPADGQHYLTSFVRLKSGWGLGLALSRETILSEIRPAVWRITILVSLIILLVGTIGVFFAQWIGRRWIGTEKALVKQTHDLGERVKELNCLYGISNFVEKPDMSLEDIFQGLVDLIPPSWQYPEITCSRIILEDKEYKTENFKETNWKQSSEIFVTGKRMGVLEICYLEEKPEINEGPFLKEERNLIDAITERSGHIIEQMQAREEKERLEDQLQQVTKMEAIAILAGGIAHEFNNALMGLMGNIELLKMDLPEDERRDKPFEAMNESGHRMSRLTDQLLAYSEGGKYNTKNLKLDDFVTETLPILKHDLGPEVRVETHFSKMSYSRADHAQMQMVLSAILTNSNEAIEDEGLIRITAGNKDIDENFTKQHPGLKPGPYVCLTIEDNGKVWMRKQGAGYLNPFSQQSFRVVGWGWPQRMVLSKAMMAQSRSTQNRAKGQLSVFISLPLRQRRQSRKRRF